VGYFKEWGKNTEELNAHFGFDASEISYLILSHAHIDHSGFDT
jgi:metallo-beta-lactamase family protein